MHIAGLSERQYLLQTRCMQRYHRGHNNLMNGVAVLATRKLGVVYIYIPAMCMSIILVYEIESTQLTENKLVAGCILLTSLC